MSIRILAAAAVLVSAAVHLKMWFDGVRDQDVIGPAFMLNAVAGVVIAGLLLLWQHWIPAFLTLGFGASTLGAFIIAATVGLFGVHTTWEGVQVWTAAVCRGGRDRDRRPAAPACAARALSRPVAAPACPA